MTPQRQDPFSRPAARARSAPVTTCQHCGSFFPVKERWVLLMKGDDDRLHESAWLCEPCGRPLGAFTVESLETLARMTGAQVVIQ